MTDRIIIPSSHVNAVGLAQSLRALHFSGPIICIQHKPNQEAIASRFPELCQVRLITEPESARLADLLVDWYPNERMTVLFTDERYLMMFQGDARFNLCRGPGEHLDTVIHKKRFYDHVETLQLASVPLSIEQSEDPWDTFGGAFRSRVWHSWSAGIRQPRGELITSRKAQAAWISTAQMAGIKSDGWGYQEQLSSDPAHNISVSGWHEDDIHHSIVTRRVSVANGLGWLVERIPDPADLHAQTHAILASFDYVGPFEMEFVKAIDSDHYKVIELNPRFWMQHRLFQVLTKHSLVRRCLRLPAVNTIHAGPQYWLNTDVAMTRPLVAARHLRKGILSHPVKGSVPALIRRQLRQRIR